jgi:hypothetical protein
MQSNLLEIPIYYFVYFKLFKQKKSFFSVLKATTVCNLLTHPIVFFVIMSIKIPLVFAILLAEFFAITSETILHKGVFSKERIVIHFYASLMANLFSWQFAPILTFLIFY